MGLAQTLKQIRHSGHTFPVYRQGKVEPSGFENLGPLAYHRRISLHRSTP